jgi:hypothetical protein
MRVGVGDRCVIAKHTPFDELVYLSDTMAGASHPGRSCLDKIDLANQGENEPS